MNGTPVTSEPQLGSTPVETVIARHTAARLVWVGPILIAIFGLLGGWDGAIGATIGVVVVGANFLIAGVMLSMALKISLSMYHAAALFGFFLRLGLLVAAMLLIVQFFEIDRVAFGISAVLAYIVSLILESVAVARGRERDLDWTS
ncbi:MAG: hypothetical protein OEQ47_10105 [Acidimicrobiia bacterium]|nr:hypothetical protein [Acidimicrobiia bacterium]